MNSEEIQTKISDIEYAIDLLEGVINDLSTYENYREDIEALKLMISSMSLDLDMLNRDLDKVLENEVIEWKAEQEELEHEYWNSRL